MDNSEKTSKANQSKQSKKTKRKGRAQQWLILPESDDIAIPDKKKNIAAINIAIVRDEHTGLLKCQPEERHIKSSFPAYSPKELAERKKSNLAKRVFHSGCRKTETGFTIPDDESNKRVFDIPDDKRKELLKLLDAGGIHSPDNVSCLSFIEAWTRYFIRDRNQEQKQPGSNKPNAKKQAQHDWITNVRNTLADYRFNSGVKQMITIFRKLIDCFDKKLNFSISDTVLRRALIKQPESKT